MVSDDLRKVINLLNQQGKMVYFEGATEEQISQFENENEVKLPEKFKEWLRFSDGGECFLPAGVQFYGVAHKPLIDVNENDRPDDNYIVIGALASGDPVLCEKAGETVAIFDNEAGSIDDELVYDDFFAFLNDLYSLLGIGE